MTLTQVMEKATNTFAKMGKIEFPALTFQATFTECEAETPVVAKPKPESQWKPFDWTGVYYVDSPKANKPTITIPVEALPPVTTIGLTDQFMRALDTVVREAGPGHRCQIRHVTACPGGTFRYTYQGQGDCLVGKVLVQMGVSAAKITPYEGMGADRVIRGIFGSQYPAAEITRTAILATQMQMLNDSRQPWHMAPGLAQQTLRALA